MGSSFTITVQGGKRCESRQGEIVLAALVRSGIALAAPCGGRGICGKCRVTLIEGRARLARETSLQDAEPWAEIKPGDSFSACRGIALSDITLFLPDEETDAVPLSVMPEWKKNHRAGIGLDIGTTTIQAELVDLDTGESLETVSALNAQRIFGADVMSRINAARNGRTGELFAAVNRQVEDMLRQCIRKWNIPGIEQCTVSGNTTMLHLFAGVDPGSMGEVPFTPAFLEERHFSGKELSLSAKRITLLPGISAFVGADIVSGLAFLDMANRRENSLLVDIGTNGEIVLWKKNEQRFLCCSAAAGPCFEGAEISCGMGALHGAINRICLKGENANANHFHFGRLSFTTLGNIQPRGICGAGLIDAIAAMKRLAAIDETGALADENVQAGFPAAPGIFITQKDVRQFQLAKSAIRSGINVLCKRAGLEGPENLDAVFICGGLGFFINPENAAATGLLPPEFAVSPSTEPDRKIKISVCGNTSLKGAVKSLTDTAFLPLCREIIARSDMVTLAADADFIEAFADNMCF